MKKQAINSAIQLGTNGQSFCLSVHADEAWIGYALAPGGDPFTTICIGYWARGMEYDAKLGWLVFDHGDERRPPADTPEAVLKAWRSGGALPRYYYRLDRAAALRAQAEGVRLRGVDWYEEDADGNFYDCLLQRALLGEEKYG